MTTAGPNVGVGAGPTPNASTRDGRDPPGHRAAVPLVATLAGLTAVAWWWTVHDAHEMSSMVEGVAQMGVAMPYSTSVLAFIGMWVAMMAAMMLPTVFPVVTARAAQGLACRTRGVAWRPAGA